MGLARRVFGPRECEPRRIGRDLLYGLGGPPLLCSSLSSPPVISHSPFRPGLLALPLRSLPLPIVGRARVRVLLLSPGVLVMVVSYSLRFEASIPHPPPPLPPSSLSRSLSPSFWILSMTIGEKRSVASAESVDRQGCEHREKFSRETREKNGNSDGGRGGGGRREREGSRARVTNQ